MLNSFDQFYKLRRKWFDYWIKRDGLVFLYQKMYFSRGFYQKKALLSGRHKTRKSQLNADWWTERLLGISPYAKLMEKFGDRTYLLKRKLRGR